MFDEQRDSLDRMAGVIDEIHSQDKTDNSPFQMSQQIPALF